MPFYPPHPGGRRFPPEYRQRFGAPNRIRRQPRSFFSPTQNQQAPTSRFQGVKTIMGHVGTVSNGINMMRQVGSILRFFK